MALTSNHKTVSLLLTVILALYVARTNSKCACNPVEKNFNETVKDVVFSKCRKCYMFTYDLTLEEDWAASLCVSSPLASPHTPLLVIVREYLSVTSFQVPQVFEDRKKSSFNDVCRTLCPMANFFDERLNASTQHIFVEVTTRSAVNVAFEMELSTVNDFIVMKDQPLTVNITPSQPRVIQYNMEEDVRAVRIEAESSNGMCMILSIEDIQCPFSDSDSTLGHSGYYQTLMTKSGMLVTRNRFAMGRVYAVLIMKTSHRLCTGSTESYENEIASDQYLSKEVTIRIVPTITDGQYYLAVFVVLIPYLLAYLIALYVYVRFAEEENSNVDIEDATPLASILNPTPYATGSNNDHGNDPANPPTPEPFIQKTKIYLSELTRKKDGVLNMRSKHFSWNLMAIAVFFAVPALQLVFRNQGIVNLTGNEDFCYYNFLCSYQLWPFSDFNHFYSNIGYVVLGILFLLLVRRREFAYKAAATQRLKSGRNEAVGVPYHFGLFYAMGWASLMEGVLSATYHVCPNKANFQFDTAFMYMIVSMCLLRVYQARHPDITPKPQFVWIFMALIIFVNGAVVLIPWPGITTACQVIACLGYLVCAFFIGNKIYFMGSDKFNKEMPRHDAVATGCCGFYFPEFKDQFITFFLVMAINTAIVIYHFVDFFYYHQGNLAFFFLLEFISNLIAYIVYYLIQKCKEVKLRKEANLQRTENLAQEGSKVRIPILGIVYTCLMIIFWVPAVVFFLTADTQWRSTPAESRELNSHCVMLNFYDLHDVWHFLSSFAIFFSYMVLLTVDDDLQDTPRKEILVF